MILKINKNFVKGGTQIGIVVLKSLNETPIEEKANNVFNTWKLGSKEKNNGALLLISISDRKFRLEVGDGLRNTVIPDYEAKNIINKMIPYFKQQAYNLGINVALFEIDQRFYQYSEEITNENPKSSNDEIQKITNRLEEKTSNTAQTTVLIWAMVILIVLVVIVAKIIYEDVAYKKEQKELGGIHHFKIKITDQYGNTTTEQLKDYANRDISEDGITREIKDLVLYQEKINEFQKDLKNVKDIYEIEYLLDAFYDSFKWTQNNCLEMTLWNELYNEEIFDKENLMSFIEILDKYKDYFIYED